MRRLVPIFLVAAVFTPALPQTELNLTLNERGYFSMPGLDVMVFEGSAREIYPEGHQGGIIVIQNGERVASNGDLRLEPTPGQWQPMPRMDGKTVDKEKREILVRLSYPDPARDRVGFNPIEYPDLKFSYQIRVRPEGKAFRIVVDLDQPLPDSWVGRVGFNLELYPAILFGKTWAMDNNFGIFPRQANGPTLRDAGGEPQAKPFAAGKRLVIAPESDAQRLTIESPTGDLFLYDGRNKHNNGWFVVRSLVPAGATTGAIDWLVTPHAIPAWMYPPVVHVSQVGYHPKQTKVAVIETDSADESVRVVTIRRISADGSLDDALSGTPTVWGNYLRYRYLQFDFTSVTQPGMYFIQYGDRRTEPFKIGADVFQRHVWQPTIEYFLPAQMCHMRVSEQYRVWHGLCHMDDALMAPTDHNHFDGYSQGPSTLTKYQPGEAVPGLNVGGWHDAGDWDLRIESQADEVLILTRIYETFGVNYDETTIDQQKRIVEIHQPDGKPDVLQQIEHGVLSILGGYQNLGRFYRGIIESTLRQYVFLGDGMAMTDGLIYDPKLGADEKTATHSGVNDDRWVFTEQNSTREFKGIAALAAAGRALRGYNDELAARCLAAAEELWKQERPAGKGIGPKTEAAVELLLTTHDPAYARFALDNRQAITSNIRQVGWMVGQVLPLIKDESFTAEVRAAVAAQAEQIKKQEAENPFSVPYRPAIWGAGWIIQKSGVEQYFLHRAFPDLVPADGALNALEFVLGRHPGSNTASFASGVGARSMTTAYGFNRADWSYIPGGVVSGTALIRPDFPELKDFPYLWQQSEYVLGGGATNFVFLVLAADQLMNESGR